MLTRLFSACVLFVAVLVTPCSYAAEPNPANLHLASSTAVILDAQTGQVLYAKDAETIRPIASITKLMTAMVVLDSNLPMDEMLTISKDDIDRLKGSYSRLRIGTRQSRGEMLRLALMSSENRAASALGRHYPGGLQAFVDAMNKKAREIGMLKAHFSDSTGLSAENTASAADLARMVQTASSYPLIRSYSTTSTQTVRFPKPTYTLNFANTNRLVRGGKWDIELSKTGYTKEAGRCLVMKTHVGERPVVMVLLNSQGKLTPLGDAGRVKRWIETGNSGPAPQSGIRA